MTDSGLRGEVLRGFATLGDSMIVIIYIEKENEAANTPIIYETS